MRRQPLISIITGFLNAKKFIQETIESVLVQTYDNWELLLVDDGSTDRSTEIARWYAGQYPGKVYYMEHNGHQNRGVCASRNLGVRKARGEYIALLDADDVWLPHKLERQVAILESYPEAGMVYGVTQYWKSWTGNPEDVHCDFVPELGIQPNTLFNPPSLLTLLYPLGNATAPCPSDFLLRHDVLERVGGFEEDFHGKYQLYEDQAFLAKVYLKESVFVASECWDKYRLHLDSCDSVVMKSGQYHVVRRYFLNWLEKYLSKQEVKNTEVWNALKKALWPYRHPILNRLSVSAQHLCNQRKELLTKISRLILPVSIRRWLKAAWQLPAHPAVGWVRFGSLRRVTPISREFGYDRGLPIDRYYIEKFLTCHSSDVRGRVLEIGDDSYTRAFGGNRVTTHDVLHVVEGNPQATFVGDLTCADNIPSDAFDCIILTQTLHLIYDVRVALKTLYRILKPGGVLLATIPGISQISRDEWSAYWCWAFTTLSIRRLFEESFPMTNVRVGTHGNVFASIAFLHGLAVEELRQKELDYCDPSYQVIITVRAVKPEVTL